MSSTFPLNGDFEMLRQFPTAHAALCLLLEARDIAGYLGRSINEFALGPLTLINSKCSEATMIWLVQSGFVRHFPKGIEHRKKHSEINTFTAESRFVLTISGVDLARVATRPSQGERQGTAPRATRPRWDKTQSELWVWEQLVLRYERSAPNPFLVLLGFEELHWAKARIDDPLPRPCRGDPAKRLRNTVQSLNGHRLIPLLVFHAEPHRIRWELVTDG
jgi:hypothetical protein